MDNPTTAMANRQGWLRLQDRRVALIGILLLALAIRLFYVVEIRPTRLAIQPEENDRYDALAMDWVEHPGRLLGTEPGEHMERMPIYPLLLAGIFTLGGDGYTARAAQAWVDTLTVLLIYLLALRTFGSLPVAGLAGLAYALYPPMIRLTGVLQVETLYVFLVVLFLLLTQRFLARPGYIRGALAAGVAFGLVVATRVEAQYFLLVILGYLAVRSRRDYRSLARSALPFVFGIAFVLAPWMGRNYLSVGSWELVVANSSGAMWANIFIDPWSSDQRGRWPEIVEPELQKLRQKYDYNIANPIERGAVHQKEFNQYVLQHPWEYSLKVLKRSVAFWFIETKLWWTLFNLAIQIPILLVALYGVFSSRGRSRLPLLPLLLWVLYLNGIFALSSAELRYAVPAMPAVLIFAAYGTWQLLQRWKRSDPVSPRSGGYPIGSGNVS